MTKKLQQWLIKDCTGEDITISATTWETTSNGELIFKIDSKVVALFTKIEHFRLISQVERGVSINLDSEQKALLNKQPERL